MSYPALLALFLVAQPVPAEVEPRAEVTRLRALLEVTTYQHRIELARREWSDGNIARAQVLLEECPESQRGFEWRFLDQLVRGSRVTGLGATDPGLGLAFRAGSEEAVVVSASGTIHTWDVGPGQERHFGVAARQVKGSVPKPSRVVIQSGGNLAAVVAKGTEVSLVDLRTGQVVQKVATMPAPIADLAFSPDGGQLFLLTDNTLSVWDSKTPGERIRELSWGSSLLSGGLSLDCGPDMRVVVGTKDGLVKFTSATYGWVSDVKVPDAGPVAHVRFDPQGKRLAVVANDRLRVLNLDELKTAAFMGTDANWIEPPAGTSLGGSNIAWSPDGTRLAAGCGAVIRVWDATGKRLPETHRGHVGQVRHVAFSPDTRRLASLADDHVLKVWDVGGQPAGMLFSAASARITGVAWSPDGSKFATASADRSVKVWEATTRQPLFTLGTHPQPVTCVACSPDGKQLATGCADGVVRTWDGATGKPLENLGGFKEAITAVAYSPNGKFLAGVSQEGTLQVLNRTENRSRTVKLPASGGFGLAFKPDGSQLAVGCSDLSDIAVRLFDPETLRDAGTLKGPRALPAVAWSPDGSILAFASSTGTRLLKPGAPTAELVLRDVAGTFDEATSLSFSPDGKRMATTAPGRPVRIWDTGTGLEMLASPENLSGEVVAFSPDGNRLALGEQSGQLRIYEASRRTYPQTFSDSSYHLAFSPDGQWIVTGVRQPAHLLQLWDRRTGQKGAVIDTLGGGLLSQQVYFSPESKVVLTLQESRTEGKSRFLVRSWDVHRGNEVRRVPIEPPGTVVHWHWIGTHLAVASTSEGKRLTVRIWDAGSGKLQQTIPEIGEGMSALRLSPEGTRLAVTLRPEEGQGTATTLLDVATGKKSGATLEGTLGAGASVGRIVFQPGGQALGGTVTTADGATSLVLWDALEGRVLKQNATPRAGVLAFSPDGKSRAHLDGGIVTLQQEGQGEATSIVVAPNMPFVGDHLAFTPDGKQLAVQGGLRQASRLYLWDIEAEGSPPRDDDRRNDIRAGSVLHREEATAALRERHWFAAVFHLDRLLQQEPEETDLYRLRGRALVGLEGYARAVPDLVRAVQGNSPALGHGLRPEEWKALEPHLTGALLKTPESWQLLALLGNAQAAQEQWEPAVKIFARAVKAGAHHPVVLERYAFAALGAQDGLLYKKIAEQLLTDFSEPKDTTTANNLAWACLVGPGVKPEKPIALARRAIEAAAQAPGETRHAYLNTLALGLYREGNLEEAERMVKAGVEANSDRVSRLDHLLLALIHGQLGKKEAARIDLAEALRGLGEDQLLRGSWEARLELAELRTEVEALLAK
jgi:WD40 repeat protein/tetratricopeptide (TPR) repeat protein